MSEQTVSIDVIRSLANGSIGATYTAVGTAFTHRARIICFTNDTNGSVFFSTDGVNDMLYLPGGSFKLFDLNTNRILRDQEWLFAKGTQIYVRYNSAPSTSSVFVEVLY